MNTKGKYPKNKVKRLNPAYKLFPLLSTREKIQIKNWRYQHETGVET